MKRLLVLLSVLSVAVSAEEPLRSSPPEPRLGPAPAAPTPEFIAALPKPRPRLAHLTGNYSVVTTNREESRNFFNTVFFASEGVPVGWNGSTATCTPGTTSSASKDSVLRRINYYRAMAGLPASSVLQSTYSAKSQQAALMMSANNSLSHFPPPSWSCYTAEGAEAADNANIAKGYNGAGAVDAYIFDSGANNTAVGHRRWLLYPQTVEFGTGDVDGAGGLPPANAIWVFDSNFGGARPTVRDGFVAWPPPGFVPARVVYNRWSFSHPGADFSQTTVAVTSNGVAVVAPVEPVTSGAGENTIVFRPGNGDPDSGASFPNPPADTVYQVLLTNVRINGVASNFTYRVTVFDPAKPGADTRLPTISGPATAPTGAATAYAFAGVPKATAHEFLVSTRTNLTAVEGAENGFADVAVTTAGTYSMRTNTVRFSGSFSWHFAHHSSSFTETLALNRTILVRSNAVLFFRSRLAAASPAQIARVEASLDDGNSWQPIYSQAGSDDSGEASFSLRNIALDAFVGRTIRVRFLYDYDASTYYYTGSSTGTGWYVDDIAFANCDQLSAPAIFQTGLSTNVSFTPVAAGSYALQVRAQVFDAFLLERGPAFNVVVAQGSKIVDLIGAPGTSRLLLLRRQDGTALTPGDAGVYDVEATTNLLNPTWSSLGATPVHSNGYLRVTDSAAPAPPTKFYRVRTK